MAVLPRQRLARTGPRGQRGGRRSSQALSLVELLVGVVLSAVIIGVAVRILVSLIQVDTLQQQELNRKGTVDRVLSLIQEEIRGSRRIETSGLSTPANCDTSQPSSPAPAPPTLTLKLILRGNSSAGDISYFLSNPYSGSDWIGPRLLFRCGPPYLIDGSLDIPQTPGSTTYKPQLILDSIADTTDGIKANAPTITSNTLSRTLELTLTSRLKGYNNSFKDVENKIQIPISINQEYGVLATGQSCSDITNGCPDPSDSASVYFTPSESSSISISGKQGNENTIYFSTNLFKSDGINKNYVISGNNSRCTIANCTVTRNSITTTITNGSVLIFPDTQIRIPES